VTPLDRVGLYVPGGKAAYPSSVLMNAIPAKVAGVKELIMVVPTPDDIVNEWVLAAAYLGGVDRVFTVGGAQAVAALAYGTETVPTVDKIVGPGNIYVATAKRMVYGTVGIDMIAGPSEILVVSDGLTNPDWLAMDLFSQAEHDEDAQSILITWDGEHAKAVQASIDKLLSLQPRKDIISKALTMRGAIIVVKDELEAIKVVNYVAPEHLELSVEDPEAMLPKIRHAGAIFMGRYTAEAIGDYCAGPNHVLPTSRTARFSSPLGVYDFQKRSSLIFCSADGANSLGKIAGELADAEGLHAHAASARYRVRG
jgi:histidinol dehydrogenase